MKDIYCVKILYSLTVIKRSENFEKEFVVHKDGGWDHVSNKLSCLVPQTKISNFIEELLQNVIRETSTLSIQYLP